MTIYAANGLNPYNVSCVVASFPCVTLRAFHRSLNSRNINDESTPHDFYCLRYTLHLSYLSTGPSILTSILHLLFRCKVSSPPFLLSFLDILEPTTSSGKVGCWALPSIAANMGPGWSMFSLLPWHRWHNELLPCGWPETQRKMRTTQWVSTTPKNPLYTNVPIRDFLYRFFHCSHF